VVKLYSIGEIANITGYATETIRRLERDYGLIKPKRIGRNRVYTTKDLSKIQRWRKVQPQNKVLVRVRHAVKRSQGKRR